MYRRRQQRIQKQEEIVKPVEKKVEKKQEPVIKAVVKPQRKEVITEYCPMVNILRANKYFETQDTNHYYVPFDKMIDIALSEGYLRVNQTRYYMTDNDWHLSYEKTTNWERETFICGDVIYTHNDNTSFAFLITKVYKSSADKGAITSELDMDPPVGPKEDDELNHILSSFVACTGTVYMFKEGTTLGNIIDYTSRDTSKNNDLRRLYPTNVSQYKGRNENTNFTIGKKGEDAMPEKYPTKEYLPKELEESSSLKNQFNLSTGVVVEGWLIYMKSSVNSVNQEGLVQEPKNITGDIIRTGPIVISTISKESLNLGSTYTLPFIVESSNEDFSMTYNGDSTKFASEPLNSEHYQGIYGDAQGLKNYIVPEVEIYSLKSILENAPEPENP